MGGDKNESEHWGIFMAIVTKSGSALDSPAIAYILLTDQSVLARQINTKTRTIKRKRRVIKKSNGSARNISGYKSDKSPIWGIHFIIA
jgi:hypothetical protein